MRKIERARNLQKPASRQTSTLYEEESATNSGGFMFRAYNKETGETEWETKLEAGTTGAPISYMHEGKQYTMVAIGDREHTPELVAFSLP